MFTFLTLTYNHQDYIIKHLESIKYQILNFGGREEFRLLLFDDNSTDNTVYMVNRWIGKNSNLFATSQVKVNEKNLGIVPNYLQAIKQVQGRYKLLAGDDLYYKNDLINALNENDLLFSPVIKFENKQIVQSHYRDHALLLTNQKRENLKSLIKFCNIFNAPGTFINKELQNSEQFLSYLSQYYWLEDLPQWVYFLTKMRDLKVEISKKTYVLYRVSSGISTNANHEKNNRFNIEKRKIRKDLNLLLYKYPKWINPYRYYFKILNLKVKHIDCKLNEEIMFFLKEMQLEEKNAQKYLDYICKNADTFYRLIERENVGKEI